MSHSLTAVVGLGLALGSTALMQPEPVQSDELMQTEIAPGASIAPLPAPTSRVPAFVLMDQAASGPAARAEAPVSLTIGTSGLLAFGPDGIRMPVFEPPDIPTGSVTRIPRR